VADKSFKTTMTDLSAKMIKPPEIADGLCLQPAG
jgi:hypothetical protein